MMPPSWTGLSSARVQLEAFELGTLKNKDLRGHEIQTQLPDEDLEVEEEEEEDGEDDNEGEEEELVLDENDISEEIQKKEEGKL